MGTGNSLGLGFYRANSVEPYGESGLRRHRDFFKDELENSVTNWVSGDILEFATN